MEGIPKLSSTATSTWAFAEPAKIKSIKPMRLPTNFEFLLCSVCKLNGVCVYDIFIYSNISYTIPCLSGYENEIRL